MLVDRFTSLRMFGNFHWPPWKTSRPKRYLKQILGVVELHYLRPSDTELSFVTCLRWIPFEKLDKDGSSVSTEFHTAISELDQIAEQDSSTLADVFGDGASIVELLLSTAGENVHLMFSGAFLVDMFRLDEQSNYDSITRTDPRPYLRWPTLREASFNNGKRHTELVVTGSEIHLHANLPMLYSHLDNGSENPVCIHVSATYSTSIKSGDIGNLPTPTQIAVLDPSGREIGGTRAKEQGYAPMSSIVESGFLDLSAWSRAGARLRFSPLHGLGWLPESSFDQTFPKAKWSQNPTTRYGSRFTYRTTLGLPADQNGTFGTIRSVDGKLQVAVLRHPIQWLNLDTQTIDLIAEIRHTIPSSDIWSRRGDSGLGGSEVRIQIVWSQSVTDEAGVGQLFEEKARENTSDINNLLDWVIKGMRLARLDLRHIRPEQPQSVLPELNMAQHLQAVTFALCTKLSLAVDRGIFRIGAEVAATRPGSATAQFRLTLHEQQNNALHLNAWFPSFDTGEPREALTLCLVHDPAVFYAEHIDQLCMFRITPAPIETDQKDGSSTTKTSIVGRLGGLQFESATKRLLYSDSEDSTNYSYLRFGLRPAIPVEVKPSAGVSFHRYNSATVRLRVRFAVQDVAPLGVDLGSRDRAGQSRPLLIRLYGESPQSAGDEPPNGYILDVRESISATADRRLQAVLFDMSQGSSTAREFVVISEEPFSIIKTYSKPLQERGDRENALVATFNSESRSWQFKTVSRLYHYAFPPQAVGESMDKPSRLEIHDAADEVFQPFPSSQGTNDDRARRRHVVEFRLTPSAELWVRPTDRERGYFLPEWDSKTIFRQWGVFGLGAALDSLVAEFLYGLSVGIRTELETGPARNARVAEIEALTGHPPGDIRRATGAHELRSRWFALSKALARRPERLELWTAAQNEDHSHVPATFRRGARFALRDTAIHRSPVREDDAQVDPGSSTSQSSPGGPRIHEHGLSGGALWPIESRNVFSSLLRAPRSTGGEIDSIALSPLGGDANQKAEFRNGIIKIISETRGGFVQHQKVEVLGRIGVFWHRAKHVVVFERTVNPSAQFTPEGGIGSRTRRPILRKVTEYIEILEPERSYPDFDTAGSAASGFLDAVRFNSRIINVDSFWGEDLDDYGWKVPLWNRRSARVRPQVYPRPDISFVVRSEGSGENPVSALECAEPDNIVFFTDTVTDVGDTNVWPARVGIDFANLPAPTHATQGLAKKHDDYDACLIPRGFRRFTWRLAPSSHKTTMNAERGKNPVYAELKSITFTRSSSKSDDELAQSLREILDCEDNSQERVGPLYWRKSSITTNGERVDDRLSDVAEKLKALVEKAESDSIGDLVARAEDLRDYLNKTDFKELFGVRTLDSRFDPAEFLDDARSGCQAISENLIGSLKRKKLLVLQVIQSWAHEPPLLERDPDAKEKIVEDIVNGITDELEPLFGLARQEIGSIRIGVEKARAIVRDFEDEVEEEFRKALKTLSSFRTAYNSSNLWSPSRFDSFESQVQDLHERVNRRLETVLIDARRRLLYELDDFAQEIASFLPQVLRTESKKAIAAFAENRSAKNVIDKLLGGTAHRIHGLLKRVDGVFKRKEPLIRYPGVQVEVEAEFKRIVARLEGQIQAPEWRMMDDLINGIDDALDSSSQKFESLTREINERIKQLATVTGELVNDTRSFIENNNAFFEPESGVVDDLSEIANGFKALAADFVDKIRTVGDVVDAAIRESEKQATGVLNRLHGIGSGAFELIDEIAGDITDRLSKAQQTLSPANALGKILIPYAIRPAVDDLVARIGLSDLKAFYRELPGAVEQAIDQLPVDVLTKEVGQLAGACDSVTGSIRDVYRFLQDNGQGITDRLEAIRANMRTITEETAEDVVEVVNTVDRHLRAFGNDLLRSAEMAASYYERLLDAAGNVAKEGLSEVSGNILSLYSAVASAPELPNLTYHKERLGYYYNQLTDVIDTTPVKAQLGRLGDELKAIGLNFPLKQIGDRLLPDDLSQLDISEVVKNLGGINFDNLFKGLKLPSLATDAIRVTHAFDERRFQGWVQADIDLPLAGRKTLFSAGPFTVNFVDSRMTGYVRVATSGGPGEVSHTGRAELTTHIEVVASGQTIVTLRNTVISFDQASGVDVSIDPRNVHLHSVFRFIQQTLAGIFPDQVGGIKVVKNHGVPVGLEHVIQLPPVNLQFGTSGVTNLQISNQFKLIAYPDFLIADRFYLSKPELPFIFSLAILGGTGYVMVETEYLPTENELAVRVEAAAGGSAALGFAFGPVGGSVFMSLYVALSYRKSRKSSGGSLSVAAVLMVAGNVRVAGIVTVYIGLMLRMLYRDSGRIDASGTLTLSIRISRFFKLRVRSDVRYNLRGGQGRTTTTKAVTAKGGGDPMSKARKIMATRG